MAMDGVFVECFDSLSDPRMVNKCRHQLIDIVFIAICGTIAQADTWEDMVVFAEGKAAWLGEWITLPNGIPSPDTLKRVFSLLDAKVFGQCFMKWVARVFTLTDGQVVAIDGKTVRGTCDKTGQNGLHLVSAWAAANQLTLGQVKVDTKANEIVAIPELLTLLTLKGCVVTVDAIGCQKDIVSAIRQQSADYVLTVKGNQPKLQRYVQTAFAEQDAHGWSPDAGAVTRTEETAHGRHEIRQAWVLSDTHAQALGWLDCHTLVRIERITTRGDKTTHETHYYISSLHADAAVLLQAVRDHWGIENSCHWVLEVAFHEDASRTRVRNADDNLALLRKIALEPV